MKTIDISNLEKGMTFPSYRQLCMAINQPIYSKAARKKQMKEWRENYFDFTESRSKSNSGGHTITIKNVKTQEEVDNMIPKSTSTNDKYVSLIETILINSMTDNRIIGNKTQLYKTIGLVNQNFNTIKAEKNLIEDFDSTGYKKSAYMNDFKEKVYNKARGIFNSALDSMENRKLITYSKKNVVKKFNENAMREPTEKENKIILEAEKQAVLDIGYLSLEDVYYHRSTPQYYDAKIDILHQYGIENIYMALVIDYIYPVSYPIMSKEELEHKKYELNNLFTESITKYFDKSNYLVEERQKNMPSLLKKLPQTELAYLNNYKMATDALIKL